MATVESTGFIIGWKFFNKNVKDIIEKNISTKKRRNNSKPIYINRQALRTIKKKRKLWEKYRTLKADKDLHIYKEAADEVARAVKEAEELQIKLQPIKK